MGDSTCTVKQQVFKNDEKSISNKVSRQWSGLMLMSPLLTSSVFCSLPKLVSPFSQRIWFSLFSFFFWRVSFFQSIRQQEKQLVPFRSLHTRLSVGRSSGFQSICIYASCSTLGSNKNVCYKQSSWQSDKNRDKRVRTRLYTVAAWLILKAPCRLVGCLPVADSRLIIIDCSAGLRMQCCRFVRWFLLVPQN